MKRFAFIAMLVVFSLVLVTCDEVISMFQPDNGVEYTDVEYEIEGPVGRERVKTIKLYLKPDGLGEDVKPGADTYGVPVSDKQRAAIRALSTDTAAASHDYFEAVFVAPPTTTPAVLSAMVARAQWEIGQPAGISGLRRGDSANATPANQVVDYRPISGTLASNVFVGKKSNKTLLGVGYLTHVNDSAASATNGVNDKTFSVTFTVAPLKTWIGFRGDADNNTNATANVIQRLTFYGAGTTHVAGAATFVTATGVTRNGTPATGAANYGAPVIASTRGGSASFTPLPGNTVTYPLYALPIVGEGTTGNLAANGDTIDAIYTIGGLSSTTDSPTGFPSTGLWPAVLVYGAPNGTGILNPDDGTIASPPPRGGLQVIKRKPRFLFNGRAFETGSYDSATEVNLASSYTQSHGSAFVNVINLRFTIHTESSGIFAFTFQCPVYSLTTLASTNDKTKFTKWFVRPADGPDLYLLDNGRDDGGMVMLGDKSSISDDWIQIITTGIGFSND